MVSIHEWGRALRLSHGPYELVGRVRHAGFADVSEATEALGELLLVVEATMATRHTAAALACPYLVGQRPGSGWQHDDLIPHVCTHPAAVPEDLKRVLAPVVPLWALPGVHGSVAGEGRSGRD